MGDGSPGEGRLKERKRREKKGVSRSGFGEKPSLPLSCWLGFEGSGIFIEKDWGGVAWLVGVSGGGNKGGKKREEEGQQ